ncbi:hypothetical protein [Alicyclobacillus macrosporangiidus]|uniref:Uncharacterized protein n=1 Tax=Alicyclobacillus macrosporangiidus TaxID=392015 RepID=A0A1I7IBS7_9BACL|nr:hypothetical protein [Alicyclobacillus macrosporangiidus]SFU70399.1 hypothetical protein SAMN05421543_106119 [Alicyclobacillus macrosporangiidus]
MAIQERAIVSAQPNAGLSMVMDFAVLKQRLSQLQQFVREYMVPGEDYGIIEGANSKPTLLKPGAEKLCDVYGLSAGEAQIEFTRDDTKTPIYISYRVSLPLISRADGRIIMVGVGSANSWEKKYRWRWVFENELPPGMSTEGLRTRTGTNKKGERYVQYRIPNDEIDDIDNTLLKMAKKRALIDAVLSATRSSALFTQDVEDMEGMLVRPHDTSVRDERRMNQPPQSGNGGAKPASDRQLTFLQRKGKAKGLEGEELTAWVHQQTGKPMEQLTSKEASQLIDALDNYHPPAKGGPPDDDPFAGESLEIDDADLPF